MSSLDFSDTIGAARAFEALKSGTGDDFVKAATEYRLAHTPPESGIKPCEGPLDCLSPEETLAAVKGKKILSVERCDEKMKAKILKDFGIVVEDVKFDELNAAWEKVPDALARAKVDEWKRTARKIAGVSDETPTRASCRPTHASVSWSCRTSASSERARTTSDPPRRWSCSTP